MKQWARLSTRNWKRPNISRTRERLIASAKDPEGRVHVVTGQLPVIEVLFQSGRVVRMNDGLRELVALRVFCQRANRFARSHSKMPNAAASATMLTGNSGALPVDA